MMRLIEEYRCVIDEVLIEYDGELLSVYKDKDKYFIKYWCDCDEKYNRWMWFQVDPEVLEKVKNRTEPVSSLMLKGAVFGYVTFYDSQEYDEVNECRKGSYNIPVNEIPSTYLPKLDAYLQA